MHQEMRALMARRFLLPILVLLILPSFPYLAEAKALDPYKVLGVDKSASQRDIQKAFHKLSLQYHPDKNKKKGAEEKFAEINNAYEILSDEEKRKNYDLYGDEKGSPGFDSGYFDAGNFGNREGYTYSTTGGPGSGHFGSSSGGWQNMGGQGETKSYSFSFSGNPGTDGSPFGFDFGNMFSNLFSSGMKGGSQFGGFSGSSGPDSRFASSRNTEDVNLQLFSKQIKDQGFTWLLLFYTPSAKGYHLFESIIEDVADSLAGSVKAGRVNCLSEQALCKDLGVTPSRTARLFVYSYKNSERGSLVEYSGDFEARNLKSFSQEYLPRFSKLVDLEQFDFSATSKGSLPEVLLLSTKKDTPVMWRVVSGLYRKHFIFYDAQVHDVSHPMLKRLGVDSLPAVVGKLVDGKQHVLRTGIAVKDLKSGVNELGALLKGFEKKNMKAASNQSKKPSQSESQAGGVPYLTASNFDSVCGDKVTVCMVGVFRTSKAKDKLETILSAVSQKTFVRQQYVAQRSSDSISYSLLDANKQSSFLYAFDKSGYKTSDKLLVAYKPRRGRFATFTGEMTMEVVERFISSVLNGDVRFSPVQQKPVLR